MDLISALFFILGIVLGILINNILRNKRTVTGVVQIDHETGLCRFCVEREDLSNPNCRMVIFTVQHDAKITEQDLENSQ